MRHHILAIGISKYQDVSINNLKFASKDASEFYNLLVSNIGTIGYKKLLIDSEATLSQIRAALGSDLQSEIEEGDAFLFFYSGHGTTTVEEEGNNSTFIVPFDATRDITNTGLSVTYLTDIFANLQSKANVIIIDSCFSGSVDLTKGFTLLQTKIVKHLKSFNNVEIRGQGTLIFTASKDNEEALEDLEYENGLFSKFLLDELQIDRDKDQYPLLDIFTPISEKVTERAHKAYSHVQTPTMNGNIQGTLYLPNFKQRINITPDIEEPPRYPELTDTAYQVADIEISKNDLDQTIKKTIDFILSNRRSIEHYPKSGNEIILEHHSVTLLTKLNEEWNKIFSETISDINEIPYRIARLEAASFQFMLLGCVIAKFGSDVQCKIYSSQVVEIFKMIEKKHGIVALVNAPEIIIVEIIYYIGVISIANMNLAPLKILLSTNIWDYNTENPPVNLVSREEIYYTHALGGNSTKVNDYIRDTINNHKWLLILEPKIKDNEIDLQLQVNFLLVMLTLNNNYLWPDFARFYANKINPLINKIKINNEFNDQICTFLDVQKEDLYDVLKLRLEILMQRGLDRYHWKSISPNVFNVQKKEN